MTDDVRTCSTEDCAKPTRTRTAELCEACYFRKRRTGSVARRLPGTSYKTVHANLLKERGKASAHVCSRDGCDRRAFAWAYDWFSYPERPRRDQATGLVYTLDLEAYAPLCQPHHSRIDRKIHAALDQAEALLNNEPLTEEHEIIADLLIGSDTDRP